LSYGRNIFYYTSIVEVRDESGESEGAKSAASTAGGCDVFLSAGASSLFGPLTLDEARRFVHADWHARFRRMRGDAVLFSFGLDSIGAQNGAEGAATPAGDPAERRGQLESLDLSVDWSRSFETGEDSTTRWAQQTFKTLLDAGLVERREAATRWCEKCRTALPDDGGDGERCRRCEGPLVQIPPRHWYLKLDLNAKTAGAPPEGPFPSALTAAPSDLQGRVEGSELEVKTMVGSALSLFTPHPERIEEARFIALSPSHPALEGLILDDDLKRKIADLEQGRSAKPGLDYPSVMDTGVWIPVPDVADPLPLIVSLAVDARFGVTAMLGIPAADPVDERLAQNLPAAPALRWDARAKGSKPRPAVRFRAHLLPISSLNGRGVQVAEEDGGRLDPHTAWIEMLAAIPPAERENAGLDNSELRRWLPSMRTVQSADSSAAILCDLALLDALGEDGSEPTADGEADAGGLIVGGFDADLPADRAQRPDELSEHFGSDVLRYALLHAAAPRKGFRASELDAILRSSASFLERLRSYAEPRLGSADQADLEAIDTSDRERRRLARWCDIALRRITENNLAMTAHRATRNVEILLTRIEDFERRAEAERGEPSPEDKAAIAVALRLLIALLTPVAPRTCGELLAAAGGDAEPSWPQARQPAIEGGE
jgi:leucyl-tRNA synthetase